ncbi:winged helix DNA-binding domain-containing protein [Streptomyces sp. H27-D2]|uniref:winged helix DNA-binding domain-containing protein n=1 Tax=Streptomyces sp. H27-D2 TaxID=3046304 RepID=UPI002DBDA3DD|nr:winged helix DNA-binding domain-containing protein [Streptomyces sp. H27-D2]MEC4017399.1 winged helix DNA-binding domain-containing protein [Streptomyces sp. H27-D2]
MTHRTAQGPDRGADPGADPGPDLTWAEVSARRLARNALSAPSKGARPADVVGAMCGAHAQVLSAAELSVGLRIDGATRTDVREALWDERSLVKTFGPRGTVHLLPTRDLPMWTGALSALPPSRISHAKHVRMTPEQSEAVVEAVAAALADAELTMDELTEAVVAATGPWAGELVMPAFQGMWPRWRQALGTAANRGALCFGPNRGRKVTYTSPQRWLPGFEPADGRAALAGLVKRYLYAYGPATPQNFARWLAVPERWAVELFDSLGDALEHVRVEGAAARQLAGDTADPADPAAPETGVRLLSYFDAYAVAGQPRELLYPGAAGERALAGGQAGNFPVLLVAGTVAGVWHQRRSGRKLHITVEPSVPLTAARQRELHDQVERVGEILEGKPELTIGTVSVGGHA